MQTTIPEASPLEQLQALVARQAAMLAILELHLSVQDEQIAQQNRHIRRLTDQLDFMCHLAGTLPEAVNSSQPARPRRRLYAVPSQP